MGHGIGAYSSKGIARNYASLKFLKPAQLAERISNCGTAKQQANDRVVKGLYSGHLSGNGH
jgi:hypothetical protein